MRSALLVTTLLALAATPVPAAAPGEALPEREAVEALRYGQNLLLAERELLDRNPERARRLLDSCPAGQRGWEWSYLRGQLPPAPRASLPREHAAPGKE